MDIRLCTGQEAWDGYMGASERPSFLQSWDWGAFQEAAGRKPWRMEVIKSGEVRYRIQGFEHRIAPGLKYLYIPRSSASGDQVWDAVFAFAADEGYAFVRIEPVETLVLGLRYAIVGIKHRQPANTLILNVQQSDDELLGGMHQKTRYNIRLAQKKGVVIRNEKQADIFWRLNEQTIDRDGFRSHDYAYYRDMLASPITRQETAWYNGEPIASNILVQYGDTLTYLHGASGNTHRNMMAPYLLQWHSIEQARALGCRWYDFWGVSPPARSSGTAASGVASYFHGYAWEAADAWTGITRFKAGFGGRPVSYGQAVDVLLAPWKYQLYTAARSLRFV